MIFFPLCGVDCSDYPPLFWPYEVSRYRISQRNAIINTYNGLWAAFVVSRFVHTSTYILLYFASWPPLNGSPTDRFEWTLFLLLFSLWGILAKNRAHCALAQVFSHIPYRVNTVDRCSRFWFEIECKNIELSLKKTFISETDKTFWYGLWWKPE